MFLLIKSHVSGHIRHTKHGVTLVHDHETRRRNVADNLEAARQWVASGWRHGLDEEEILHGLAHSYGIKGEAGKRLLDDHKRNKQT